MNNELFIVFGYVLLGAKHWFTTSHFAGQAVKVKMSSAFSKAHDIFQTYWLHFQNIKWANKIS